VPVTDTCGKATQTQAQHRHEPAVPDTARMPASLSFPGPVFPKAGLEGENKTPTALRSAGLVSKAVTAPKQHPCYGCWKQLFKIQQPLCLTTRSDLWYFLPKQFICLAQQLINSRGHPSRGLARAGLAAGPDGGCVSGINTILIDYTASGGLPIQGVPAPHPDPKQSPTHDRGRSQALWERVEVSTQKGLLQHPSGQRGRVEAAHGRAQEGSSGRRKGHQCLATLFHVLHLPSECFHLLETLINCSPLKKKLKITLKLNFQCSGIFGRSLSLCLRLDLCR